jgi:hypothetical protein
VGITRTRAQTHESGVLPYPLWVFFTGIHWAWVQLPSPHSCSNPHSNSAIPQSNYAIELNQTIISQSLNQIQLNSAIPKKNESWYSYEKSNTNTDQHHPNLLILKSSLSSFHYCFEKGQLSTWTASLLFHLSKSLGFTPRYYLFPFRLLLCFRCICYLVENHQNINKFDEFHLFIDDPFDHNNY